MTLTDGRVIVEVNFVIVCACFCARAPQILILNNPYDAFRAAFSPFNCVTCSELPFSLLLCDVSELSPFNDHIPRSS